MIKPFKGDFKLTQGFGGNPSAYARFGLKGHDGLDYGLPTGTPVYAPHWGTVTTGSDPSGYGNYVKIENEKEGSILAHLQSYTVRNGQTVLEGQQIGISDNTGNSTGAHLHWGYFPIPRNKANGYSGCIDQTNLIGKPTEGGNVNDTKKQVQFDQILIEAHKRSITPDDKSENWVDDSKLVKRLFDHIDNQEATKRQLESELSSCRNSSGSEDTQKLATAKAKAQEIINL